MEPAIRQKVSELLSVSVEERQNCARSLNRLAVQRYLYRCAERIENWRLASVVAAVSLLILDFAVSAMLFSQIATIIVVLSWSTEQACLVGWSTRMKDEAATIQEDFDCFVLKIPWAKHLGVDRPTEDRIAELSIRAARIPAVNEGLADWYGRDSVPSESTQAAWHCQRTNCRWDERLRKEWIRALSASVAFALTCIVAVAAFTGVSVMESVLLAAAALRVLTWLAVEFREQSTARERMGGLHRYLSGQAWNGQVTMCEIRLVQDAIFRHRRSCPIVPDWFYRLRSKTHKRLERH